MSERVVIADLHCHTTCSDGVLSPFTLIEKAESAGLHAMAVTDHDNMDAHRIFHAAGYTGSMRIIPGIEISCQESGREVHLLAYGLNFEDAAVIEYEAFFRADRERRAREIVERLSKARVHLSYDEVAEQAGSAPIGRPHIAAVLIRRGIVRNVQQAFDSYLDVGKPGYVSKSPFSVKDATDMVHKAGGITSVAHPGRYYTDAHTFLTLTSAGIDGIEVYHPSHWFVTREYYRVLSEQHGLLITGGSDYHGSREYDERNFGTFGVSETHLAAIDQRITEVREGILHGT